MPECIHGLEIPRCDICYPKDRPVAPVPARSVRTPRSTRVAGVSTTRKSVDPARQRVYHVTHIDNLESILDADQISAGATPTVDLSTGLTRELRLTAEVAPGLPVADHVPFYLAPSAQRWEELRTGAEDETRWSAAARAAASVDFVVLVTTVSRPRRRHAAPPSATLSATGRRARARQRTGRARPRRSGGAPG